MINFYCSLPCSTCTSSGQIACTERACVDICSQPRESGVCLAYFLRYFYNRTSMRCESFVYGGCGGNQNRFTTEAECYQRCNPSKLKVQHYYDMYNNMITWSRVQVRVLFRWSHYKDAWYRSLPSLKGYTSASYSMDVFVRCSVMITQLICAINDCILDKLNCPSYKIQ